MKKLGTLLLSIVMLSIVPISSSHAVIKAGSKCSKVGVTATIAGKKFTCVKSGKKLMWNKGVTVKKIAVIVQGVCPTLLAADTVEIAQERANALITMSEDQAEQCSMSLNWRYRVGERDGQGLALTMDYSPTRVTVSVTSGFITSVLVG